MNDKKYGLITFKETENIGDDIQSYSAMRFLPHIDYFIEREKLDLFIPKQKERVITIMNGWFLHSKINFPPSPYIYPIYISTHISKYNSGGITTEYLNEHNKKSLKKYEPIGCRDKNTTDLLSEIGVKNYFSGCLTLTIKAEKNVKKLNQICIVDIDEDAEEFIKHGLKDKIKIIKRTHELDKEKNSQLSWEQRFKNVKKLLNTYQSSKLVITSRLHCALPCLALGTPVILLYNENRLHTKDRLSDYAKILNSYSTKEFMNLDVNSLLDFKKNLEEYQTIRKSIEQKLKEQLKKIKINNEDLPDIESYHSLYVIPKKNTDILYNKAKENLEISHREFINMSHEKKYWEKEYYDALKQKDKEVQQEKGYWQQEFENLLSIKNKLQEEFDIATRQKNSLKQELNTKNTKLKQLETENANMIVRISNLEEEIEELKQPLITKIINKVFRR